MNPQNLLRRATAPTAALLALATLAADVRAAGPLPDAEHALPGVIRRQALSAAPDEARVHVDRPGDGALWARGRRWKASFDDAGATYYAGFGARQPRSLPHVLSPESVTVGGEPLAFARAATPEIFGQRVEIDRGTFVEAYELDVDSIEQLFVFHALPRAGELVVDIRVASELDGSETEDGLEFRGEHGHVTYSRAVAIDARGRRASAPTRLVDGRIQITVGAEFLAVAEMPLVIDPVVSQFWLDSQVENRFAPDMAWDPFHQVWLAVYAETFSATDIDVFARMLGGNGLTIATGYVDFTTSAWTRPRVANSGTAHRFLVVAERSSTSPKAVMGRMVTPNGTILTMDSQFDIGGTASGDKVTPDVGGDPSTAVSTNFCVVFGRTVAAGDIDIGYRLVTSAGVPVGAGPTYFTDPSVEQNTFPCISRSNGGSTWTLAWVHAYDFPFSLGIMVARVNAAGSIVTAPFALTGSSNTLDASPSVSSPLPGTQRYAIAFSRRPLIPIGSTADIRVVAMDGATVLQNVNLTAMEASGMQAQNQVEPSVETDGQHFLVAYSEFDPVFVHDRVFASDLYLAGNQLGLAQSHVELHPGLGLPQRIARVAAKTTLSGASHRYGVIYEVRSNDQNYDVSAVLFDGVEGGTTSAFCAGDGNGTACPCGNNGNVGRGCANSIHPGGAALLASGTASTVSDTLSLQASSLPPASTCLFFQGSGQSAATAFGDGLLCVGGTTIRLATKTASSGAAQFPAPGSGDPTISVRGAVPIDGGQRFYQVWYRNSAAFCTSATFNLTNGIAVSWAR